MLNIKKLYENILNGRLVPFEFDLDGRPAKQHQIARRKSNGQDILSYRTDDYPILTTLKIAFDEEREVIRFDVTLYAEYSIPARISDVRIMELTIEHDDHDAETILRTTRGGTVKHYTHTGDAFPPIMFRAEDILMRGHDPIRFSDHTGRGSNEIMPLWFYYGDNAGFWFGPEWQGTWELETHRLPETSRFALRLPYLDFCMLQGEEIKLPPVLMGEWTNGDVQVGWNHLRRTIRETMMPQIEGAITTPPAVYQLLGGHPMHMSGQGLFDEGAKAAELGAEAFSFASTWMYDRVPDGEERFWWRKMGDVRGVEDIFPDGVRAFADFLKEKDVRLGLWIDPRIGPDCPVYDDVQDILLHVDPHFEEALRREYNWLSYVINEAPLIDLSRQVGRRYYADMLEYMVEVNGAEQIWFDMNTDPRPFFFQCAEEPERAGLLELKFFQGLDAVMAEFNRRHPDVWMEVCASGGRMLSLAVMRYSHSFWITDYCGADEDIMAVTRAGANTLFPAQYCHKSLYLSDKVKKGETELREEDVVAHCIGMFGISQDVLNWPDQVCEMVKRVTAVFKDVRHLMNDEFYILTPRVESHDGWLVCQFHDTAKSEGILFAIRLRDSDELEIELPMRGVENAKAEIKLGKVNAEIKDSKLHLTFDEGRAAVVHYSA